MKELQLSSVHKSLGADIESFAGWKMPIKYDRITSEHMAVRESRFPQDWRCGLADYLSYFIDSPTRVRSYRRSDDNLSYSHLSDFFDSVF